MRERGIRRVVCLDIDEDRELQEAYEKGFGKANVLLRPVEDGTLPTRDALRDVIDFLTESDRVGSPAVVHCAAGIGRTGVVMAAWLVSRGMPLNDATEAVESSGALRNPYEVVDWRRATQEEVNALIQSVALADR